MATPMKNIIPQGDILSSADHIKLTETYSAHNYSPLGVVLSEGEGVWVKDVEGHKYLDMLAAYSAMNFGHGNKRVIRAAKEQIEKLTLTSRAFFNDQMGPFCKELAELCGMEMVLPMNSGAEGVETAIKTSRKWGYEVKKVPDGKAEIIVFEGNFAGRTTTIISFSTDEGSRKGFGPYTPGFVTVPYGDEKALEKAFTKNTVAVLIEPIQGEGGVIIPPSGFLKKVRELCTAQNALMVADEIQTGLCRTGALFACDHENVKPDLYIIGKSLGGGIMPISAVIGNKDVMGVFTPGTHGSTFGGNPFACAIAREVINLIKEEKPHDHAREMGTYLLKQLLEMKSPTISAIRGRGLMIGADIKPEFGPAKDFCKKLKEQGLLCKDTRTQTIRFTPPLVINTKEIDWAMERIRKVFA